MANVTVFPSELRAFSQKTAEAYYKRHSQPILRAVKQESPVDTGFMRRQHIVTRLRRTSNGWVFSIRAGTNYSGYVYNGHRTKGGARRGRNGSVIFTAGTVVPPNRWIKRAFRNYGFKTIRDA